MDKIFNDILFVFPIMLYYALEALVVGIFITLVWKFILSRYFGDMGYLQIVAIYWIVKMLFFDVFKLLSGLHSFGSNILENQEDNENQEDEVQ